MNEQKNFILAIVLSVAVLIGWQIFVGGPKVEQQRAAQQQRTETATATGGAPVPGAAPTPGAAPVPGAVPAPGAASVPGGAPAPSTVPVPGGAVAQSGAARQANLSASPRLPIDTVSVDGSISLRGARLDDLKLKNFFETVEPDSAEITVLSPAGSANPYYVEHGWTVAPGTKAKLPDAATIWATTSNKLTQSTPVVLTYDNGQGLVFRRTIAIDDKFMFTVTQEVANQGNAPITLFPYSLISRHGLPETQKFFILHEGFLGVLGEDGLQEVGYGDVTDDGTQSYTATGGWVGITDKYFATVVVPDQEIPYKARFSATGDKPIFQADFLLGAQTIPSGGRVEVTSRVFSGAKQVAVVDAYEKKLGLTKFDLLIDWGWFYFFTKPLFQLIEYLSGLFGNFGLAILGATVLIKIALFPLANKSYASMSKMKKLQPEMVKLRERFKDDKAKQQQALMAIYKKEKVNPMSGCLPIVVQIPIFFSLYKVLFVTIEMRHQPFYGWIQDLSAPDPTSLFNLFGLIPWAPPEFLVLGVWPIVMGITMFVQMRLNPLPPDPIQQKIFTWMPLVFTFMLARFASGLVIYWAWNNTLSIIQQAYIMRKNGVEIDLWSNIKETLGLKSATQKSD
ncbi:MAG: membrane protein insertase YidC [Alphaproteobacteria bacterium]